MRLVFVEAAVEKAVAAEMTAAAVEKAVAVEMTEVAAVGMTAAEVAAAEMTAAEMWVAVAAGKMAVARRKFDSAATRHGSPRKLPTQSWQK